MYNEIFSSAKSTKMVMRLSTPKPDLLVHDYLCNNGIQSNYL